MTLKTMLQRGTGAIAGVLLVVGLSNCTSDSVHAQSQPITSVNTTYYSITGATGKQLREQMNQLGPIDKTEGRRYDARTDWYVRWNYRYANKGGQCKITTSTVNTDVTITLPQWNPPASASRALVKRWQRYLKALRTHEDGHKDQGLAASREILALLKRFPAQRSCPELETAANAAAQRIIKKYNQRDIDYDRKTRHGATQGAVFAGGTD